MDRSADIGRSPDLCGAFVFPGDVTVIGTDQEKLAAIGVSNPIEIAHALGALEDRDRYADEVVVRTTDGN